MMNKSKTIEQFKNELKSVWGDKYIVSHSAVYVNTHTKIEVVCDKNGVKMLYYTDYKGEIQDKYKQRTFYDKCKLLEEIKK